MHNIHNPVVIDIKTKLNKGYRKIPIRKLFQL